MSCARIDWPWQPRGGNQEWNVSLVSNGASRHGRATNRPLDELRQGVCGMKAVTRRRGTRFTYLVRVRKLRY